MIHHARQQLHDHLRQTESLARKILLQTEYLMATMQDLMDEIGKLKQSATDYEAARDKVDADLNQLVTDLKAQLATGTPVDTQAAIDAIEAVRATMALPAPPAPPVTPAP